MALGPARAGPECHVSNANWYDVRIPNPDTETTFRDTDAGRDLITFDTADDLIRDLGI